MSIRTVVLVVTAAAASAVAGDDSSAPACPPVAAAPTVSTAPPADVAPFRCKATLANGRSFTGVVRAAGTWEKQDDRGAWTGCAKADRGARLRLWYVGGREGFVGLVAVDVTTMENLGAVDADAVARLAADKVAAEKQAADERTRLHKARDVKRAAATEEAAKASKAAAEAAVAKQAEDAAAAAKTAAALLAKFPPSQWNAARRDEILRRSSVLHIRPTADEREFVEKFAVWASAAAAAEARAAGSKAVEQAK